MEVEPTQVATKKKSGYLIILIMALVVCCFMAFISLGIWTLSENVSISSVFESLQNNLGIDLRDDSQPQLTPTATTTTGENEESYTNPESGVSIIYPKNWTLNARGGDFTIQSDIDDGKIDFQVVTDPAFNFFEGVDQEFCDSFEQGFREGLGDIEAASQFDFQIFLLNGNEGCRAEGQLFEGIYQKYYVFFNTDSNLMYTIFYTSSDLTETQALSTVMDTFSY